MASDLRKLKDRALEHIAKRRFAKAAEVYGEICLAEPRDLQLRQRWGDALRSAGRAREAVNVYRDVADAYASEGQLLKAIAVNKVLLEVDPRHTETQRHLADLYAQRAPARPLRADSNAEPRAVTPLPTVAEPALIADRLTPMEQVARFPRTAEAFDIPIEIDRLLPDPSRAPTGIHEIVLDEGVASEPLDPAVSETVPRIPESPLFEALDPDSFVDLLHRCRRRPFAAGDVLIRQGEPARSFFVLSEGELKVVQSPPADLTYEIELARLSPGDFFGELALVSESPRIASVVAIGEGEALEFPGSVLQELVAAHPAAEAALHKFTRARLLQNAMATSPLFRPFDRAQRKHLIARFVIREVPAETAVLTEGQQTDGLYVVMQGRFRVDRGGQRLATLLVGDVFGEISLLTRAGAGAAVTAEGPGRVLRLPRQAFDELILTHPQVLEMVSNLAEERQQLNAGVASGKVTCDVEGLILM